MSKQKEEFKTIRISLSDHDRLNKLKVIKEENIGNVVKRLIDDNERIKQEVEGGTNNF